jgi:UDP-glucose 4-epimerase
MRSLVTGGAGFIGSHLVDALVTRGDEVTVLDDLSTGRHANVNQAAHFVEHDIREPFDTEAEVVFHLGAQADVGTSVDRPAFDAAVNVVGTVNVLEAARAAGAALVFASTGGAIYGDVDGPAPEDGERRPVSPYEGGVIAIFLERMERGEETVIFGDGEQTRDFVHVADVVRALVTASEHDGGVFNIGTGVETSINRVHELCRAVVGAGTSPRHDEAKAGDARRSVLDVSRAERELGWRPEVGLEDGLGSTWEAVRKE